RVVGINTAVIASAHGIGFAISINTVKPILRALVEIGRVVRPTLRLDAVSVTPQRAYANGLPVERGALVTRVEPGGPAEVAGIRPGDVITRLAGEGVRDLHHFHAALWRRRAGDAVEVTLWRDGETLTVTPVLTTDRP
ncbi:MAG: PDZ domain-containing protein, partial [Actinobacteria bacterium]|nr:PDZ domain-containing protein [Actinomycetota bacterium]